MDIYISKKCPHCKKLLVVFYNNKHLIQYFNIIDVESVQIPNYITSVPTLVYNGELYNYLELRAKLVKLGFKFKTTGDTEVFLKGFVKYKKNFFKL